MKTLIIATATVLSLSAGVANANEGGPVANTQFTSNPSYLAQVPVQAPSVAAAQSGQAVREFEAWAPVVGTEPEGYAAAMAKALGLVASDCQPHL